MRDLISRQAAIDAIGEKADEIYKTKQKGATYPHNDFFQGMAYAEDVVKRLPSAQPEQCEDVVSREKVKELAYGQIRSEYSGIALKEQREAMLRIADNVIGLLPSVTPKQRTGKWIHVSEETWKCDQCGEISCCSPRYCPDCGSRNEVTE